MEEEIEESEHTEIPMKPKQPHDQKDRQYLLIDKWYFLFEILIILKYYFELLS